LNINQLSWDLLPFRDLSHGTLPSRSLVRPKSVLLKSRAVSLLCVLLAALRILNSTISWSLQPRLPLSFPTSPSLLARTRPSIAPLLVGSSVAWRRKSSSTHSRNLLVEVVLAVDREKAGGSTGEGSTPLPHPHPHRSQHQRHPLLQHPEEREDDGLLPSTGKNLGRGNSCPAQMAGASLASAGERAGLFPLILRSGITLRAHGSDRSLEEMH